MGHAFTVLRALSIGQSLMARDVNGQENARKISVRMTGDVNNLIQRVIHIHVVEFTTLKPPVDSQCLS